MSTRVLLDIVYTSKLNTSPCVGQTLEKFQVVIQMYKNYLQSEMLLITVYSRKWFLLSKETDENRFQTRSRIDDFAEILPEFWSHSDCRILCCQPQNCIV